MNVQEQMDDERSLLKERLGNLETLFSQIRHLSTEDGDAYRLAGIGVHLIEDWWNDEPHRPAE